MASTDKNLFFILFLISTFLINIYLCKEEYLQKNIKNLEPNLKKLKEISQELFPEGEPAAGVLIMKGDKIIFEEYYGLATLPNGPKTDKDTRFNIASISKQFTSLAVLQLVEKGKISLEETLDKYVNYTDPLWKKVKIKHLLSHSSGIPDDRNYLTKEQKIHGDEILALEYLEWLNYTHFEPGTNYEYLNPTYILLGRLVAERNEDQDNFTQYVQKHIFNPANMTQTAYIFQVQNPAHAYEYNRSSGDSEESGDDRPEGPHDWYEFDYGEETFFATRPDGGIYTTPRDFVKWELALPSLLTENLLNDAFSTHTKVYGSKYSEYQNRPGTWYGYGWFIEPEKHCIYHTGDNGGFKILASRYPDEKTLVLVFAARADWDRYGLKTTIEELLHFSPKVKNKIIFLLQIQMINKKLKIYAKVNFPISKIDKFKFNLVFNSGNNNLQEKEEEKTIKFSVSEDYEGKIEKIIELTSEDDFNEKVMAKLKNPVENYDIEIMFNDNKNNLDTKKVKSEIEKGGVDYSNIPSDYKFYNYIIDSATSGCEFYLNSIKEIQVENKNINLNFIEVDGDNVINSNCQISKDNGNNISCKINKNIDNNYFLEPFIYSDNSGIISISQVDTNNYLTLKCHLSDDNDSSKLSTTVIIVIIVGILGAICLALIIFCVIKMCVNKNVSEINNFLLLGVGDKN